MRLLPFHFLLIAWVLSPLCGRGATALGGDVLWHLPEPPVVEKAKQSEALDLPLDTVETHPLEEWVDLSFAGVLGLARDDTDYLRQLREKRLEALVVKARLQTGLDPVLLAGADAPEQPIRFLHRRPAVASSASPVGKDAVYVRLPPPVDREANRPALGLSAPESFFTEDAVQPESKTYALTGLSAPVQGNLSAAPMAALHVVETGPTWDLQVFNAQPTALLTVDPFGSLGGWYSRDGEMTVSHSAGGGNPGGAMQGSFASQFFPIPQTDAFRLDTGSATPTQATNFLGDYRYIGLNPDRVTWVFDFKAEHILPSDLVFRFSDGSNTFFFPFDISSVGSWNRVFVPLDYTKGWVGGNASLFDLARQNVTSIEIQVTRNGNGFQRYYVDNLEVRDFSIPEPDTLAFLAFGTLTLFARRWFTRRRNPAPGIEPELP